MLRLFTVIALLCVSALAQGVSSSVNGLVVDPSGASIPGASLKLTNEATGATQIAPSGSEGRFVFPIVPAGTYTLEASSTGFKALHISGIAVTSSEIRSLGRLTMQVGEVRESVNVTAEAAVLQ